MKTRKNVLSSVSPPPVIDETFDRRYQIVCGPADVLPWVSFQRVPQGNIVGMCKIHVNSP